MIKLRIEEKNKYNYLLKDDKGEVYFLNIEFYDLLEEPKVNDYIYLSEKILNNKNLYSFGPLTDEIDNIKEDIIKVIINDKEYYLERYYG